MVFPSALYSDDFCNNEGCNWYLNCSATFKCQDTNKLQGVIWRTCGTISRSPQSISTTTTCAWRICCITNFQTGVSGEMAGKKESGKRLQMLLNFNHWQHLVPRIVEQESLNFKSYQEQMLWLSNNWSQETWSGVCWQPSCCSEQQIILHCLQTTTVLQEIDDNRSYWLS